MRTTTAPARSTAAADGRVAGPALPPARGFAAPSSMAGDAGHDFADVAVRTETEAAATPSTLASAMTRPSAAAPVQRVRDKPKKPKVVAPGTQHHDPAKKKHLASGVGATQNAVSAQQLALIQANTDPTVSRRELKREAKALVKGKRK
ncbi:MAG TPA: hypothetical protein VFQ39_20000 [Longimicrobium sp.]|nr:hypothetical protein [Longimicrobium sp.]